jgi:hypothetical protein
VICLAYGLREYSSRIEQALIYALQNKCVVIAAASNDGRRSTTYYPARSAYVICARSANHDGINSKFNPPRPSGTNFAFLGEGVASTTIREEENVESNDSGPPHGGFRATGGKKNRPQVEGMAGCWKRSNGTSTATAVASAIAVQIMDYGRLHARHMSRLLESPAGIRNVFREMHHEAEPDRFSASEQIFVVPWKILTGDKTKADHALSRALDAASFG